VSQTPLTASAVVGNQTVTESAHRSDPRYIALQYNADLVTMQLSHGSQFFELTTVGWRIVISL